MNVRDTVCMCDVYVKTALERARVERMSASIFRCETNPSAARLGMFDSSHKADRIKRAIDDVVHTTLWGVKM